MMLAESTDPPDTTERPTGRQTGRMVVGETIDRSAKPRSDSPRSGRSGGLVVHLVLLSVLLVGATAIAVGLVSVVSARNQVVQRVDRRLMDGVVLFEASLEDQQEGLRAVGGILASDADFVAAVQNGRTGEVEERLRAALGILGVDEIIVARPDGEVVGTARGDRLGPRLDARDLGIGTGFATSARGEVAAGLVVTGDGQLAQRVYLPVRTAADQPVVGVLSTSAYLDRRALDRFRARTGLQISLFVGRRRIATTLDSGVEAAAIDEPADRSIADEVVGQGHQLATWRNLRTGPLRARFAPLANPDGQRIGMIAVGLPVEIISHSWRDAVIAIVPLIALIMLIGAVLAYALARRVREPILALAAAAGRLRAGDLSTPIPAIREVELLPLAEELERARESVRQRIEMIAGEEARWRALLAALGEPILVTTAAGELAFANDAARDLFPRLASPARQPSIGELLPFVDGPGRPEGALLSWQGKLTDSAGRILDVAVSRATLAEGWLPGGYVYVVYDISSYTEMNRLREQLLYDVAHELRGPLATLGNALDILASSYPELTTRDVDRLLGSATRTVTHLRRLMEDLLSAGSIQAGRFAVYPRPVDLPELLEQAIAVARPALERRQQQLVHRWPTTLPRVLADPEYVAQVEVNLLTNASKYSPPEESIIVAIDVLDRAAKVSVEDHGPGIPLEQRAGLFERFYRLRRPHDERGIGLGLAIARGIVEAHGGQIEVESTVGVGTVVWCTLPLAGGRDNDADTSGRR